MHAIIVAASLVLLLDLSLVFECFISIMSEHPRSTFLHQGIKVFQRSHSLHEVASRNPDFVTAVCSRRVM